MTPSDLAASAIIDVFMKLNGLYPLAAEVHQDAYTAMRGAAMDRVTGPVPGSKPPTSGDYLAKQAYLSAYSDLKRGYKQLLSLAKRNNASVGTWRYIDQQVPSPRQFSEGGVLVSRMMMEIADVKPVSLARVNRDGRVVEGPCLPLDRCYETLDRARTTPRGLIEEPETDLTDALEAQMKRWQERKGKDG